MRKTPGAMADPVAWVMIETGWKVVASDGSEVGEVDEVTGDSGADIFDGLAIATSMFGKPRYVPSEQVAEITEGTVRLALTREQVEHLRGYRERAHRARQPRRRGRRALRGGEGARGQGRCADPAPRALDEHLAPNRVLLS